MGFRTKLRFILDQKDRVGLEIIRSLFDTGLVYDRKLVTRSTKIGIKFSLNNTNNQANSRYVAESYKGLSKVVNYFRTNPLKTFKNEAFKNWVLVYLMIGLSEHLNDKGFVKIRNIAKSINEKPDFKPKS